MSGKTWQLMAEMKNAERNRLEQLFRDLRAQYEDLVQRERYLEDLVDEYGTMAGLVPGPVRCDDQMLAGRRYLVQLMNMKNAVTVKQMDLSIHMQRVSQALQQSDVERQRYVKLNELHTGRQQRQEQRREQQEEDSYNLMHYNHLKGEVW